MKRKGGAAVIIIRTTVISLLPVLPRIHLVLSSSTFFSLFFYTELVDVCTRGACNMWWWRGEDVEYKSTSVANDDDAVPWSPSVDSLILTRGGETSGSFEKKSFPHCCLPIQLLFHFLTLCNRQYILGSTSVCCRTNTQLNWAALERTARLSLASWKSLGPV